MLKTFALIALALASAPSFAQDSLSCEGRELQIGNQGRTGSIQFNLKELTASGIEGEEIIGANGICGTSTVGANCVTDDNSMSLTPSFKVSCLEGDEIVPFTTAYLVYSKQGKNGRMVCESTNNKKVIEFNNCQ